MADYTRRMRQHLTDAEDVARTLTDRWRSAWNGLEQRLRAEHVKNRPGSRFVIENVLDGLVNAHSANHFAAVVTTAQQTLTIVFPIFNDFAGGTPEQGCADFVSAVQAADNQTATKALFRVLKRVRDHDAHGFKVPDHNRDAAVLSATLPPLIELAKKVQAIP